MELKKVSYSLMSTYDSCPYKYYLSYIRGLWPEKKAKALCVGGAIHLVLAEFYKMRQINKVLSLEQANEVFKKGLEKEPIKLNKDDSIEKIIKETEGVVQAILDNPLNITPAKVEFFFQVPFKNPINGEQLVPNLSGIIDLTSTDDIIIEHKSSSHKYKPEDMLKSFQHIGYFVGFYNAFGRIPQKILYNVIYKAKNPVVDVFEVKVIQSDVEKFFKWADGIIKGIQKEDWTAKPSFEHCMWCDNKLLCPFYKGKLQWLDNRGLPEIMSVAPCVSADTRGKGLLVQFIPCHPNTKGQNK